jgi:anti-sigma B factor antagonist
VVNRDLLEAAVTVARHSLRASEQAAAPELRVDLSGLEFIDVSGCRVLLQCADELLAAGGRLVLVAPRPHIRRTLRLAQPDSGAPWHLVEFPRE